MASRTAHLREQLTVTLEPFLAEVPTNRVSVGEWVILLEAQSVARQLTAVLAATDDDQLDEIADRAVMTLLGAALGRDGMAGGHIANPLDSLITSRKGEGASRVALALLELWATLERPLPATAITAVFAGVDVMRDAQNAAVEHDASKYRLSR